jgi:aerobic-type carbon monoxide dehydrogenase small subunit (CoxS/CutS family)
MVFTLLVNGTEHRVDVAPEETLLNVLRNNLELTGTKYDCGRGSVRCMYGSD